LSYQSSKALHDRIVNAPSTSAFTVLAHECIHVCVKYERAHMHYDLCFFLF
jgi:hypothetical protein